MVGQGKKISGGRDTVKKLKSKEKESGLQRTCLEFLQYLENLDSIVWWDRLNSGEAFVRGRKIGLCREGTADAYIMLHGLRFVFVEFKRGKEKQTEVQKRFQERVDAAGFLYWVVRSFEEFKAKLGELVELPVVEKGAKNVKGR